MSSPLRIGIVGAGANTREKHLPGFQAIPGVELTMVANRTRESGETVARDFRIPHVAAGWTEVVNSPDVDAVCIGTWPNLHASIAVAALRAGKHVLTEARMAATLHEAEQMLDAARQHPHLVAQIVPAPMSLPFDAAIGEFLDAGVLGELREITMTATSAASANPAGRLTWRQDITASGQNTMFLGIYYEMVARWLGRHPQSLLADAAIFTPTRLDAAGAPHAVAIPESLAVVASYGDGLRLVGHFSGVETSGTRSEIRLNGTQGGLRLDLARGELTFVRGDQSRRVEVEAARGGWRVEADFVDSIRNGTPVRLTDFESGVAYMRFTARVWDSWSRGGRRVEW